GRLAGAFRTLEPEYSVMRHERILDHNGITIRPLHADDVPLIVHPVICLRHKTHRPFRGTALWGYDAGADRHPIAAPQAAQEAPPPAEPIAARHRLDNTHRSERI